MIVINPFVGAMNHSNGTTNGTAGENGESRGIDEGLYSRQLFVLGRLHLSFLLLFTEHPEIKELNINL